MKKISKDLWGGLYIDDDGRVLIQSGKGTDVGCRLGPDELLELAREVVKILPQKQLTQFYEWTSRRRIMDNARAAGLTKEG